MSVTEKGQRGVFASDLGLRPGEWPVRLRVADFPGLEFVRQTYCRDRDGDIQYVRYFAGAQELLIFND